jgi:antitoxin component YwqK of YwqJK toxin-antitoxin module
MGKAMSKPEIKRAYYENGNILSINHILNGKRHREDGPAYTYYHENGSIRYESYRLNGRSHREDGPARIFYNENGNIQLEEYYINGEMLTKEEWYSRLTTEQKVNLLYGKGNE